jgi:hypothetical protein
MSTDGLNLAALQQMFFHPHHNMPLSGTLLPHGRILGRWMMHFSLTILTLSNKPLFRAPLLDVVMVLIWVHSPWILGLLPGLWRILLQGRPFLVPFRQLVDHVQSILIAPNYRVYIPFSLALLLFALSTTSQRVWSPSAVIIFRE